MHLEPSILISNFSSLIFLVVDDDDLASEDGSEHENDEETGTDFDLSATIETVETDAQTQATGTRFKKDVVVAAVRKVRISFFVLLVPFGS